MESIIKRFHVIICLILGIFAITICSGSDSYFNIQDINIENETKSAGNFHPKDTNLTKGVYIWFIQPNEAKHSEISVNLFFESLFLHENDMVTIFKNLNDTSDDSKSIVSPIHAQNGSVTIMTDLLSLYVKLQGNTTAYIRKFQCYYSSDGCFFNIPPTVSIIHSPIYIGKNSSVDCQYTYVHEQKKRVKPVFQFDAYNYTQSTVELMKTTYPQSTYNPTEPMDFFPADGQNSMFIIVHIKDKNESFRLLLRQVDSACSQYKAINTVFPTSLESPSYVLDNGTIGEECLWIIKHANNNIKLGVSFTDLHLSSVLDIIAINDGATFNSQPLFQVTASHTNTSMNQLIRSSGPYLWLSFKPVSFISEMKANITVHGQGGHYRGSGHIKMNETTGNDTIYMLEVEESKAVMLNFTTSKFQSPALVSVYDGFDRSKLITSLDGGEVWYPILSQSSKMMIIATGFEHSTFEADFNGVVPGCMQVSTLTNENYVLSGNCNSTCKWIIPPQNVPGSTLLLHLQYIALSKDDIVEIYRLDKTFIGSINASQSHVPTMSIPSTTGAMVQITRKSCSKPDDVILIGHSSFVPACGGKLNLEAKETFHITSPSFPDTYPLFSSCNWTLSAPKGSLVHLSFDKIELALQHCLRVFNSRNNVTSEYTHLPDDLFVSNGSVVEFIADKCKASKVQPRLVSSEGFTLNGTVAECGDVLDEKLTGRLLVNVSTHSLCMWRVSVPVTTKGLVNIIAYNIAAIEDKGNYEMKIFDGLTVQEPEIVNSSTSLIWGRKNGIIVLYKRLNVSLPSSVFLIDYKTITCNLTMMCDNKLCMHPDWVCNGRNDCGDYSDEKNCDTAPPPPVIKQFGYSATTFWVTLFCMLGTGVVFGIMGKIFHEKYKNGQYHRFSDISVIE